MTGEPAVAREVCYPLATSLDIVAARRAVKDWAGEIGCTSWAQILLKFVLGHPAVTCVIPGTSRPEHMRDNAAAGSGVYPDAAMRARMAAAIST